MGNLNVKYDLENEVIDKTHPDGIQQGPKNTKERTTILDFEIAADHVVDEELLPGTKQVNAGRLKQFDKHFQSAITQPHCPSNAVPKAPASSVFRKGPGPVKLNLLGIAEKFRSRGPLVLTFFLFSAGVVAGTHGFSFALWHDAIDGSAPTEVIAGKARGIRSDDWLVALPAIQSQLLTTPSFSDQNALLGAGRGVAVNAVAAPIPTRTFVTFFRPYLWGYFIGPDTGMSWHWWFNTIGLLYSSFLVMMVLSRGRMEASLLIALSITYSPFFQFWSLNSAPMAIGCLASIYSVHSLLTSKTRQGIAAAGIAAAYWGTAFFFAVYPPYQITLGYLFLFILAGLAWESRHEIKPLLSWKMGIACLAAIAASVAAYRYYLNIKDPISIILNTSYPGQRVSLGGGGSWTKFFNNLLFTYVFAQGRQAFGNICEGASFFFFFPALLLYAIVAGRKVVLHRKGLWLGLMGFLVGGTAWLFVKYPSWFAKATLLSMVPEDRAVIALGVANACFILVFSISEISYRSRPALAISIAWLITMLALATRIATISGIKYPALAVIAVLSTVQVFLFFKNSMWALRMLAAASIASTIAFNPVAVGGTDFIKNNGLSTEITRINSSNPGIWLSFDDIVLPNLFRMIGVEALNGVHFYPQFAIWRELDPDGRYRDAYNRYAHVVFEISERKNEFTISNPQEDVVLVRIHPEHPALARLGVRYLLVSGKSRPLLDKSRIFSLVAPATQTKFIYRRTGESEATAAEKKM